jgi:hypothetical protein
MRATLTNHFLEITIPNIKNSNFLFWEGPHLSAIHNNNKEQEQDTTIGLISRGGWPTAPTNQFCTTH